MHAFKMQAPSVGSMAPIDVFKSISSKSESFTLNSEITGDNGTRLDAAFWLPFAAKELNISPNIRDYVIVPTVGCWSEIPNTNGDCVTKQELTRWLPDDGMCAYKTFKGKPTFIEHNNKDHSIASGVIFDSFLKGMPIYRGNHVKLMLLLGFDRNRDPELCRQILEREATAYSIGMNYSSYTCSASGQRYEPGKPAGRYTKPGVGTYMDHNSRLIFRYLHDIRGFETSSVAVPAFNSAIGDTLFDMRNGTVNHYD